MADKETNLTPPEWEDEDRRDVEIMRWLKKNGLDNLARDISDSRLATRLFDIQHDVAVHQAIEAAEIQLAEKLEARVTALNTQFFDKAASYNNLIISLGYAATFAVWSYVKDEMHPWDVALVGLLLGSSLILFVSWTLLVALYNSLYMRRIAVVMVQPFETREAKVDALIQAEMRAYQAQLRLMRFWLFIFLLTVTLGILAACCLITALFAQVAESDFTLFSFKEVISARLLR